MALSFYVSKTTSSSIIIQVSGSGSGTLYCTNGTSKDSVSAGSYEFDGLSAGTQYGFRLKETTYLWYPYLNMICDTSDNNGVNLRSGPGSSYSKVTGITEGSTVSVISNAGSGWYYVQYGSYNGYVAIQYFTITGASQNYVYGTTSSSTSSTYYAYLTFNANGGSGAPSNTSSYPNTYSSAVSIPIPYTVPTYDGRTFNGWYCSATGTTYQPGGTFTGTGSTSYPGTAYTLVAQWSVESQHPLLEFSEQSVTNTSIFLAVTGSGSGVLYGRKNATKESIGNHNVTPGRTYEFSGLSPGTEYGFRLKISGSSYLWYPRLKGKCIISNGVRMRTGVDSSTIVTTVPYGGVITVHYFVTQTSTHDWVYASYGNSEGYIPAVELGVENNFNFNDDSIQDYINIYTTGATYYAYLIFDDGAGSGAPDNVYGKSVDNPYVEIYIPETTPIRSGYTFSGWTFNSKTFNAGDKFTGYGITTSPGQPYTLTAVWTKIVEGDGVVYINGIAYTPYIYNGGWVAATVHIYNGGWVST